MINFEQDPAKGDGPTWNRADRRKYARAIKGGVVLRPGSGSRSSKVRNVQTGRVLPCCYSDCTKDGDVRIDVRVPHEQPRWRDGTTGEQEMLVYIFCSEAHKTAYLSELARR